MQELFYVSASSSLTLIKETGEASVWDNISNLVISSSAEQIVAFSGSTALVYFPLENTNLYYTTPYPTLTSFYPYNIPTASADTSSLLSSSINVDILIDPDLPEIAKNSIKLYFYSSSAYYVSESSVNNSYSLGFSVAPNQPYSLVMSGSGAFLTYITANDPQVVSVNNASALYTSSVNKPILAQFTPSASTSYDVSYIVSRNFFISSSIISWSFSTNLSNNEFTESRCVLYDTNNNLYYVSHSGVDKSGSFNVAAGNIVSASLFGWTTSSLFYTASMYVNNITLGTSIFSTSLLNTPVTASFTTLDANTYQVTMSVTYSGETYLKYAEAVGFGIPA